MISYLTFVILLNSGLWRHRRMQRTQQRRLHWKLSVSQLCGKTNAKYYWNTTHGSCMAIISVVWVSNCGPKKPDVFIPAQGSYHCGSCKSGFTGDQMKGCKPELSCSNSLTNPCDINAQCTVERDGSISCQVGFHTISTHTLLYTICTHRLHISTSPYTCCLSFWRVSFVLLVWNWLGR